MSVEGLVKESREHVDMVQSMGHFGVASKLVERLADKLEELAAENERLRLVNILLEKQRDEANAYGDEEARRADKYDAAEQAEPAPADPCKHPVWGQDNDGTRVCAKCGLVEHPAARSGAVKAGDILKEAWSEFGGNHQTAEFWQDFNEGVTFSLKYLAALEPAEPAAICVACEGKPSPGNNPCAVCGKKAEPATDVEPVAWSYEVANYIDNDGSYTGWVGPRLSFQKPNAPEGSIRNVTPLYTRPPESRLHEALEFYADSENWKQNGPLDPNSGNFTGGPARAALAQEDGR